MQIEDLFTAAGLRASAFGCPDADEDILAQLGPPFDDDEGDIVVGGGGAGEF